MNVSLLNCWSVHGVCFEVCVLSCDVRCWCVGMLMYVGTSQCMKVHEGEVGDGYSEWLHIYVLRAILLIATDVPTQAAYTYTPSEAIAVIVASMLT